MKRSWKERSVAAGGGGRGGDAGESPYSSSQLIPGQCCDQTSGNTRQILPFSQ